MHGAAQPAAEVSPTAELRRKAEQRLRNKTAKPFEVPADTDARALVHELQVHQIELEVQNEELLAENGELRLRLAEATEALDAIRRGEVDAIVVQRADGPKVYTITGADEPYRVMVEEMQEGAVTLREDGIVVYCNKQIARMLRTSHQSLLGKPFRDFLVPADLSVFEALLRNRGNESSRGEVGLAAADGTQVPVHLAFRLLSTEEPSLISLVITDLTEQKRHEKIVASEAFSSSILDQAADAVVVCDESGRIIRANRAAQRLCGTNPLFEPFDAAFPLQLPIEPSVVDAASDHSAEQFALFPLAATARVVSGVEAALPSPGAPA